MVRVACSVARALRTKRSIAKGARRAVETPYHSQDLQMKKPEPPKVVDLNKVRYGRTVMYFYDKFDRAATREREIRRSEVERENKKKW